MNTIPLTFNEHEISRTILGGAEASSGNLDISVILLNTIGSQFKLNVFDDLLKCGFDSIISIEPNTGNYNLEEISRRYTKIKFIIPHEKVSDGEMINMSVAEIKTKFFLVLKDSLYIPQGVILPNLAETLTKKEICCIAPRLVDINKKSLPIQKNPTVSKSRFVLESLTYVEDNMNTVYPFDYIGLYSRDKFMNIGGFDYTIQSPYWQLLDFGVRAWLWGEEIKIKTALQLSYNLPEAPVEDKTVTLDSLRFYLKNELPKYKEDHAFIKKSSFWRFYNHSSCGFFEAKRQFNDAVAWVDKNKFRYQKDLPILISNWGK